MSNASIRKILPLLVIVCTLAAGLVMQVHWRWSNQLHTTSAQLSEITATSPESDTNSVAPLSQEALMTRVHRLEARDQNADPAAVYDALVDAAESHGLVLDQIAPTQEVSALEPGVTGRTFAVTLSGTYDALCGYLDTIRTLPAILRISEVRLAQSGSASSPRVAARLLIQHIIIETPPSLTSARIAEVLNSD